MIPVFDLNCSPGNEDRYATALASSLESTTDSIQDEIESIRVRIPHSSSQSCYVPIPSEALVRNDDTEPHNSSENSLTLLMNLGPSEAGEQNSLGVSSLESMDAAIPADQDGQEVVEHLDKPMLRGMLANNILCLWQTCGRYRIKVRTMLQAGRQGRNAFDLAGKLPFSLKMMSLGVTERDLLVDSAQAGGLFGTADGFFCKTSRFLEIKGAKDKNRATRNPDQAKKQFEIKKVRVKNTSWQDLIIVCRPEAPNDWTSVIEYDRCGFWLGHVTRTDYLAALRAAGKPEDKALSVTVTPGAENSKNWLGRHIEWIQFRDLTSEWCKSHGMCR